MAVVAVSSFVSLLFAALISINLVSGEHCGFGGAVFGVNSKFYGKERSLGVLKAHDNIRHLQILSTGVSFGLGGTGRFDAFGVGYLCS